MGLRDQWVLLKEGLRLAGRELSMKLRHRGPKRYQGSSTEIARRVVEGCWNGEYFCAGIDHLDQFWIRDLAICCEGLLDLGHRQRVLKSLSWALGHYQRHGHITTTIFLHREPVDIFSYASDSLPFLLHSLELAAAEDLRAQYRGLIEAEAERYACELIDPETGRLRRDRMFSGTKDTMEFKGTCYASAMAAWCSELLTRAELKNPLAGYDLKAAMEDYWTGSFFRNDLEEGPPLCSADANFWPYWCGVVEPREPRLRASIAAVQAEGLDKPFPLKYHARRMPERELGLQRLFLPNYQGDAIWTFFSMLWIELVAEFDLEQARQYVRATEAWLEKEGTWIEVFQPDGQKPLVGRLGHGSDWGMLWAAQWPRLLKKVVVESVE